MLTCPYQLPSLRSLTIGLKLQDQRVDLRWVLKQACDSLTVRVRCVGDDPARHRTVVQQLQRERLQAGQLHLELELQRPFTKQLQMIWSKLRVDTLTVACDSGSGDPDQFDSASKALEALPSCCDHIEIDCRMCSRGGQCFITWSALTWQAADIELLVGPTVELHVLGFDEATPGYLQEPWRLSVHRARRVHGLPPALMRSCGCLYMQNAAADRADQDA